MKEKLTILLAMLAIVFSLASCGGEDDPSWQKRDVTFKTNLLNHVYDSSTDKVYELTTAMNTLVFHRKDNTADVTLVPGEAAFPGLTFQLTGIKLELDSESGRYTYKGTTTPNSRITNFSFIVDFNEQSMEAHYTVDGKVRVVSQLPQVFFLANASTLTYRDGKESVDKASVYQFDIDTESMTATMHIGPLTNTNLVILFETIIARSIPVTVTKDGIVLESAAPVTVSQYGRYDSSAGTLTTVDAADDKGYQKFPIVNLKATLMLDANTHETSFKMGRDDESTKWGVKATGQTYSSSKF